MTLGGRGDKGGRLVFWWEGRRGGRAWRCGMWMIGAISGGGMVWTRKLEGEMYIV